MTAIAARLAAAAAPWPRRRPGRLQHRSRARPPSSATSGSPPRHLQRHGRPQPCRPAGRASYGERPRGSSRGTSSAGSSTTDLVSRGGRLTTSPRRRRTSTSGWHDFAQQAGGQDQLEQQAARSGVAAAGPAAVVRDCVLEQKLGDALVADVPVSRADARRGATSRTSTSSTRCTPRTSWWRTRQRPTRSSRRCKADPSRSPPLPRKYSTDTSNKDSGGDLGFAGRRASSSRSSAKAVFAADAGSLHRGAHAVRMARRPRHRAPHDIAGARRRRSCRARRCCKTERQQRRRRWPPRRKQARGPGQPALRPLGRRARRRSSVRRRAGAARVSQRRPPAGRRAQPADTAARAAPRPPAAASSCSSTSPRVAPGMPSAGTPGPRCGPGRCSRADPEHPQLPAAASRRRAPSRRSTRNCRRWRGPAAPRGRAGAGSATWLAGAGGDERRSRSRRVATQSADADAASSIEVLHGSCDLPGARLLDVVATMDRLRSPGGCPWDAKQTHETPRALPAGGGLRGLPGDRGRRHRRAARGARRRAAAGRVPRPARRGGRPRTGAGAIDDVAADLVDKLVRRHPHVFADRDVAGRGGGPGQLGRHQGGGEGRPAAAGRGAAVHGRAHAGGDAAAQGGEVRRPRGAGRAGAGGGGHARSSDRRIGCRLRRRPGCRDRGRAAVDGRRGHAGPRHRRRGRAARPGTGVPRPARRRARRSPRWCADVAPTGEPTGSRTGASSARSSSEGRCCRRLQARCCRLRPSPGTRPCRSRCPERSVLVHEDPV